jgi:hypothetical protein
MHNINTNFEYNNKYTSEYTLYRKCREHLSFKENIHQLVADQGRSSQP